MRNVQPVKILGIDPGLTRCGVGLVEENRGRLVVRHATALKTSPADNLASRLWVLRTQLQDLVKSLKPDAVAVEKVYLKHNAATASGSMQAAGVAMSCASPGIPVFEYSPATVKKAISGNGAATKQQIAFMMRRLVGADGEWGADAMDALAVAVTCIHTEGAALASRRVG